MYQGERYFCDYPELTPDLERKLIRAFLGGVLPSFYRITKIMFDHPLDLDIFSNANHLFEYLTIEYMRDLSRSIKRLCEFQGYNKILEVGAGGGRLTHFLRESLCDNGIKVVATDDGSWHLFDNMKKFSSVYKMGYNKAIKRFSDSQTVILSCWMPYGEDWTPEFRKAGLPYVIIGEGEDGCVGSDSMWEKDKLGGYTHDIFVKTRQLCRTDDYNLIKMGLYHSYTWLFSPPK